LLYSKYWLPLQQDIESRDLETVFWIESLWRNPEVRLQDTYTFQKNLISNLSSEELSGYLENTKIIGDSLKELIHKETRSKSPFSKTLEILRRLDIPGAQVLIVRLLYLRKLNVIEIDETQRALNIVLGYLIRRAIAAVPVNTVGGISNAAAFNLRENAAESLHKYLSTGKKKYVTNEEINRIFLEEPVYKRRKMRLILELLLQEQQNTEEVNWEPMTIEHVLPQNPSEDGWEEFRESCADEDAEFAFESLVDTLGNLTLTVYNSALSNSAFKTKKTSWLANTGVTSSQLIAKSEVWGPAEIRARSKLLATKAIEIWPGPDESLLEKEPKAIGERIDEVVRSIPAGSWTSYGDIAEVVGTASMVVGNRIAGEPTIGAWRVLRANGKVSRHFRWNEDSEYRDMSPLKVLELEGLEFTIEGLASPESRLDAEALRDRLGEDS
jgi:alkylated DNA nucleotide flippase Atl1